MATKQYTSSLTGSQMDAALTDMATHVSERYAKGTENGTPVTSGTGYQDNSKYYKELAAAAKTDAETAQGLAEDAQEAAETAQSSAEGNQKVSERYAKGTENGTPVSSGIGYQDNSKYYKELAQAAKTDAEMAQGLAENAQEAAETAQGLAEDAQEAAETAQAAAEAAAESVSGITYTTTAPTSANTSPYLKIAVLSSEPATKYSGWLYFIEEA